MNKVTIVIVNGALRVADNPLLEDVSGSVIFVFAMTPYYFGKAHYTDIPNVGENKVKYLFACINKFKGELKETFNADLLVLEGSYKQVVDQIVGSQSFIDYGFNGIEVRVIHQPYLYEEVYEQELLDDPYYNLLANEVSIINKGMTLVDPQILESIYVKNKKGSGYFKTFLNECFKGLNSIKWIDSTNISINPVTINDLECTDCSADTCNLHYDLEAIKGYTRNKGLISGGSTTMLEGALSLGTISKINAYAVCLNSDAKDNDKFEFIRSLIWNDYCWIIAQVEGTKIFSKDGLSKSLNNGKLVVLPDFLKGTGFDVKFYNKTVTKLRTEGYLPNRLRMVFGYFVIKVLGYSHLALAEYFEHYLLNNAIHNNWLGCQSCNGTGVDTILGGRNFNVRKQLEEYDLNREYL